MDRVVIDAQPAALGDADTGEWRTLITAAAGNPLVFAKVSGLYPGGPRMGRGCGRGRPGKLLCDRGLPDLFFPPVWSRVL